MKKIDYINIMERVLDAYSDEHINRFFDEVKEIGITEHGFPRLTSNIGILLSYGKKLHLKNIFKEMMDYCCENISTCKENTILAKRGGGNEFSVRELCLCLKEVEEAKLFDDEVINNWKAGLKRINPPDCYKAIAKTPTDHIFNWALFGAVSEQARKYMGFASEDGFIEMQLATQLLHIDKNGMYKDADNHPPMLYDLVARGLFALLLTLGYEGKHKKDIEDLLLKSADITLKMQSVTGEMPFGGRSNQFYHNEAWLCLLYEFYAKVFLKNGNKEKASQFKRAATIAYNATKDGLSKETITHIKNNFPIDSSFGCEAYAYFDKYMVSAASFFYGAAVMCDDNIEEGVAPSEDSSSYCMELGEDFAKLFLKSGDYVCQIDLDANMHYDAYGIGRIHKKGTPAPICLSVPVAKEPKYNTGTPNPHYMSLCAGYEESEEKIYALEDNSRYEVIKKEATDTYSMCELKITIDGKKELKETVTVTNEGVAIEVSGDENLIFMLPAIKTDGTYESQISLKENNLSLTFMEHNLTYSTNGKISYTDNTVANRNGIYYVYEIKGDNNLKIDIAIS